MTDDAIITRVIEDEGGEQYTDRPDDKGGPTKWGITRDALAECRGRPVTSDEVRALTLYDAKVFYTWLMISTRIEQVVNDAVRYVLFDAAVNMGAKQAVRLLQRALGVKDDGVLGPVTLASIPRGEEAGLKVVRLALAEKMLFYGRLAAGDLTDADKDGIPDYLEFLNGWLNRTARQMREFA